MPLYTFRTAYAGKPVTVAPQAGGAAVASGTTGADKTFTATLPAGEWVANVDSGQSFWPVSPVLGVAPQSDPDDMAGAAPALRLPALAGLTATLADGTRSQAVQVLGDSTGNDTTDWVYRLAQAVAVANPTWTVVHRLFDDTTQSYGAGTVVQTGTAGARYLDGATGAATRLLQADAVNRPHISGPIDVRLKVSMTDWTPAALSPLVGKSGGDPNRGWYAGINTTGLMFFTSSTGGLGADLATMYSGAVVPFADGATEWLRWVWTPDTGSSSRTLQCYTSADGATWTQLGTTTTTAGAVALFNNSTRGYEVGGASGASVAAAKIYEVEIRNGVAGPSIVPALPDLWPPAGTTSATYVGAPVLTFVNGSVPGQGIAYLGDAVRLPKLTQDYGQTVGFLSTSHNEGLSIGRFWTDLYRTFRDAAQARLPGASLIALTQNPEKSDTNWSREHAKRRLDLIAWGNATGLSVIDTWAAFVAQPDWATALMADSVHPNATGSDVWRDAILSRITA